MLTILLAKAIVRQKKDFSILSHRHRSHNVMSFLLGMTATLASHFDPKTSELLKPQFDFLSSHLLPKFHTNKQTT